MLADPAHINRLATVLVVVPGTTGSFTVVNARADGNTGAAIGAMFGLVGVTVGGVIDATMKSSSDARDMARFENVPPPDGIRIAFVDAFRAAVARAGRPGIELTDRSVGAAESRKYEAVAILAIGEWGLRRLERSERSAGGIAGFLDIDARLSRSRDGEVLWSERETVIGKGRGDITAYQADGELLRRELRETFAAAGHRMAMEILYPRARP